MSCARFTGFTDSSPLLSISFPTVNHHNMAQASARTAV